MSETLFIGGADDGNPQILLLRAANRHGLVAGATGTGKTVTLQILAQGFAEAGTPVFCADVKGDLSGLCVPGSTDHKLHDKLLSRAHKIGFDNFSYEAAPVIFWDIFGKKGHPVRTTIAEMGPVLLARLMDLNPTQEGVLTIGFEIADRENLLLLDLKDLRSLLVFMADNARDISAEYGNVTRASVGAIQRRLLVMHRDGAEQFFGEPALSLKDFMRTDDFGRGFVNILDATQLIHSPRLYSIFLLWLLSELFEELPEVGDPDRPKLVFFFDEAHLLFKHAPRALLEKIEQVVKLIRSKGVGVYFVTQNPRDIPDSVLAQLGNRIQHALRAYTPNERKAVRAAAQSFRPNPAFDTETTITELGIGEALVSTLDKKGRPSMVARTLIRPPSSRLGPAEQNERDEVQAVSPVAGVYDTDIDRDSAYENLAIRKEKAAKIAEAEAEKAKKEKRAEMRTKRPTRRSGTRRRASRRQSIGEAALRSAIRTASTQVTRKLVRGILGSLFR
ncbi:MAG: ATP-binding protein [Robiginitomaculum sp.]|nr:MAG: ATP-binding protein [Robiginitomaculum sp.]